MNQLLRWCVSSGLALALLGGAAPAWSEDQSTEIGRFVQERVVEATLYAIEELPRTRMLRFVAEPEYPQLVARDDPHLELTLRFNLEALEPVLQLAPELRERGQELAEIVYRTLMSLLQYSIGVPRSRDELRGFLHRTLVPALGLPPMD